MSFSWQGDSGRWYEFDVARAKRAWESSPGVYMFVKPGDYPTMEAGGPITLYISRTQNMAEALGRNDMWQAAQQLGAGEIHLCYARDDADAARMEADLLAAHAPILNQRTLRRVA